MNLSKVFIEDIRKLIVTARETITRGVDLVQVYTNFEIGRCIVEQEQAGKGRAAYGQEIIKALSKRLMVEFGKGFSARNLAYMRIFYLQYQGRFSILQSSTAKLVSPKIGRSLTEPFKAETSPFTLSWTHDIFLLGIKNTDERSFYEVEATQQNWKVRELKRQFDSSLYERLALSRDKAGIRKLAKKGQVIEKPEDLLKEPLVLEFLGLEESSRYSESDVETAIINQIEHFLLELGKGFLFEGRQRRFSFDNKHFFVDLVFYNRLLNCFVLIDLKIGELTHQDVGQMQMYVNYYDRVVKTKSEHKTIGIVLCKQSNTAVVEFTLPKNNKQIFSREYKLYLPSKQQLKKQLM